MSQQEPAAGDVFVDQSAEMRGREVTLDVRMNPSDDQPLGFWRVFGTEGRPSVIREDRLADPSLFKIKEG